MDTIIDGDIAAPTSTLPAPLAAVIAATFGADTYFLPGEDDESVCVYRPMRSGDIDGSDAYLGYAVDTDEGIVTAAATFVTDGDDTRYDDHAAEITHLKGV